ncbi:MAG: hypothetical protein U0793_20740 [Gemmataceae bacterium]
MTLKSICFAVFFGFFSCGHASAQEADDHRLQVVLIASPEMRYDAAHAILIKLAAQKATAKLRMAQAGSAGAAEIRAGTATKSKDVARLVDILFEGGIRNVSISVLK